MDDQAFHQTVPVMVQSWANVSCIGPAFSWHWTNQWIRWWIRIHKQRYIMDVQRHAHGIISPSALSRRCVNVVPASLMPAQHWHSVGAIWPGHIQTGVDFIECGPLLQISARSLIAVYRRVISENSMLWINPSAVYPPIYVRSAYMATPIAHSARL